MLQINLIIDSIKVHGQASIPVAQLEESTKNFLRINKSVYNVYLPGCSISYVITLAGQDGQPHESATASQIGSHNLYNV